MCRKLISFCKAHIGCKSNNNTIIQHSKLQSPVFASSTPDLIKTLGDLGHYDAVEKFALGTLAAVRESHPLYPDFSAKPNEDFSQLISTPETEDAFRKYPKKIKGTYRLDYTKYPHMDRSETPWEYAYRTQTRVELLTTAYQEYLGDTPDPFPEMKYRDGMITIIGAPEFPPAVEATIVSGDISIPIMLRRKPCMKFGTMLFGTESGESGFHFNLTTYKDFVRTDVKIIKIPDCDLRTHFKREQLISAINETKKFSVYIGSSLLVTAGFTESDLKADMFSDAGRLVEYLGNLLTIEDQTGCTFDTTIGDVTLDDFHTAYTLASSLNDKWHCIKMTFDDDIRCHHQNIPAEIAEDAESGTDKIIDGRVLSVSLQGQRFSADRYLILYRDARIDNVNDILKLKKRHKKNIQMIFRPANGKNFFYKYCKFEGIRHISDETIYK